MAKDRYFRPYKGPVGGWGSLWSLIRMLFHENIALKGAVTLWRQNKTSGYMCVSCAWAKPAEPRPFEFCENGAKATAWELTSKRTTPEFFAEHTLSELRTWSDLDLEEHGRLTYPLRYEKESDRYVPVAWEDAFRDI